MLDQLLPPRFIVRIHTKDLETGEEKDDYDSEYDYGSDAAEEIRRLNKLDEEEKEGGFDFWEGEEHYYYIKLYQPRW